MQIKSTPHFINVAVFAKAISETEIEHRERLARGEKAWASGRQTKNCLSSAEIYLLLIKAWNFTNIYCLARLA